MRRNLHIVDLGDLLEQPLNAVLATYLPSGDTLLTPVWYEWRDDGFHVVIVADDIKDRNLQRDPRASLVVAEHGGLNRGIEVRGTTRHWRAANSCRWKSNSYPTLGSFERDSESGSISSHTTASLTACITPMTRAITTARPTPCTQVRGMPPTCSFLSSRSLFRIPQFPRRSSKPVS